MLALMLARAGIDVTLLEAHRDFDRDFRGDSIHASILEIMDELGLIDRLLQLPHARIDHLTLQTPDGPFQAADFSRLKVKHPFVVMMPQVKFLEFITREARLYSNFHLIMGARVEALIKDGGSISGVQYRSDDGQHAINSWLTVGCDGRFSIVRKLAGLEPIKTSPPIDVLWFRLPRRSDDPENTGEAFFGAGHILILLNRAEQWQIAYLIPKDSYQKFRTAGLEALRRSIAAAVPRFADRVNHLQDWKQISLLSVESSRVRQWYQPGLLLIGDAAHVMSPVAGVGINYAIQDAVVAANVLIPPLRERRVEVKHLAEVQRQREWPTRLIQAVQSAAQKQVVKLALDSNRPFKIPALLHLMLRVPIIRDVPARVLALGIRPVHVKNLF